MSDKAQNDWDVVAAALVPTGTLDGPHDPAHAGLEALSRLRESTEVTITGLNERIAELEAGEDKAWPVPAELPPDYWETAQ